MDEKRKVWISKFLSKHLRHNPEALGLTLSPGGWVRTDDLLAACAKTGRPVSRAELDQVVAENPKQRFAFSPDATLIRAQQGHSIPVDLDLEPQTPPEILYHGTPRANLENILAQGLQKMNRHHVHLSADPDTARIVGARRGKPIIFLIQAALMHNDGFVFYRSGNGVWLVDAVPPQYLAQNPISDPQT